MNSNESKKNKKTFIFCLRKYNFENLDLGIFLIFKIEILRGFYLFFECYNESQYSGR